MRRNDHGGNGSSPRPAPIRLRVEGLSIRRNGIRILEDIHWTVRRGEHWAILGANGSGKTSLLRALTGYFMPTSGDIRLLGNDYGLTDWREVRKRIGLVSASLGEMMAPDEPALHSVVSGRHAGIDHRQRISRKDREKAGQLLEQVECSHLAMRTWNCLSQGERQRVLIGRALMAAPPLLVLDEPCAGLDPAARETFLQFLEGLGHRRGAPILVLVTHHVEELVETFSHVLMLRKGRVLCSGPHRDVMNSRNLTRLLDTPARLRRIRGRYSLRIAARPSSVV